MAQSDASRKAMFAKSKLIAKSIGGKSQKEVPELYQQLEDKNRQVPKPTIKLGDPVFRDDPEAIPKQKNKVKFWEEEQDYWKGIVKEPSRSFGRTLGDARWWALGNTSTNLREAKKKLEKLKSDEKKGIVLKRNPTFIEGKKRFFFTEEKKNG